MFGEQRDTTVQKQRPQWNMELWLCHSGDAPLRLELGMFWSLGKALTEGKTTLLLHLKKIKNLVFVSLQDVQQWLNSTSKKSFFHINKSTIWINDILNRCETHHDSLIHLYSLKLVKLLSYWIPFNHCKKNMKKSYIWTLTKCSSPNTPPLLFVFPIFCWCVWAIVIWIVLTLPAPLWQHSLCSCIFTSGIDLI